MLKRPDRCDRCLCEEAKDDCVVSVLLGWVSSVGLHRTAEDSPPSKCNMTRFYVLWLIDKQVFCLYAWFLYVQNIIQIQNLE